MKAFSGEEFKAEMHLVVFSAAFLTFLVVSAVGTKDAAVSGDAVAEKDELDGSNVRYGFHLSRFSFIFLLSFFHLAM